MRKQDYLLQLINSLTAAEKRNFTLFTGILAGDKQYIKLFEALQGQDSYDAEQLRKDLNITSQQLADQKYYLAEVLLKSLRIYEEDNSEINYITQERNNAGVLAKRKMYNYTLEVVDKALIKSKELELFDEHMALLTIKHSSLAGLARLEDIAAVTQEQLETLEKQIEYVTLSDLAITARYVMERPQKLGDYEKVMNHQLIKTKVERLKSVRAKLMRFTIDFFYAGATRDIKKILELAKKEFQLFHESKEARLINPISFAVSYTRLADAESAIGNYDKSIDVFEQLQQLLHSSKIKIPKARAESIGFYADYKIAYQYQRLKNYSAICKNYSKLEKLLERRPQIEQYHIAFIYAVALLHEKHLNDAMAKVEELATIKTDVWVRLQPFVRVMIILMQLSLGNYELVTYQVRTTRLWMKRNKISSPETSLFLSLVYPMAKASLEKRKELYIKLQEAVDGKQLSEMEEELNLSGWIKGANSGMKK